MSEPANHAKIWKAAGLVSAIGADIAVCTVLGFYGGRMLGGWLGNEAAWTAFGVLFGILLGFTTVFLIIRKVLEEQDG